MLLGYNRRSDQLLQMMGVHCADSHCHSGTRPFITLITCLLTPPACTPHCTLPSPSHHPECFFRMMVMQALQMVLIYKWKIDKLHESHLYQDIYLSKNKTEFLKTGIFSPQSLRQRLWTAKVRAEWSAVRFTEIGDMQRRLAGTGEVSRVLFLFQVIITMTFSDTK